MDMILLLILLVGAIMYTQYNTFKVNRECEEMNRFYRAELEELKRRVNRREIVE